MRLRIGWLSLALLGAAAASRPAAAMQFRNESVDAGTILVGGRGPIIAGDLGRLTAALGSVPAGKRVLALALDSPGGSVAEAERMARLIRDRGLAVFIPTDAKCVSACFLLLAAAPRRFAAADALVGVHSASEHGEETEGSLAVTTAMARIAAGFGVPPVILGKMVQTTPGRVEWLTREDLAAMGVVTLNDAAASAAPAPPVAPLAPPVATPAPPPVAAAAAAQFHGAFFCTSGPASLALTLAAGPPGERRRAVVSFGPTPTNRQVPSGSFVVEGRLDLSGGVLDLAPVAWVSQPAGFAMLGLKGSSDDGGKTFAGRVTATDACTLFTLRRTH